MTCWTGPTCLEAGSDLANRLMTSEPVFAPPLRVSQWFNSPEPISLASLRGRVVLLHAFQMLCPGCVSHGLPQAIKVRQLFAPEDVAVIGLHTVFEHHAVMNAAALQVFISEYRLPIPIGVDEAHGASSIPLTMHAYGLHGTPSVVLIDRLGHVRLNHFGHIDDMALGGLIGQLIGEPGATAAANVLPHSQSSLSAMAVCGNDGCAISNAGGSAI